MADIIYGGLGADIMVGGGGADIYIFHDEDDGAGSTDIIQDFSITDDLLDFSDIKDLRFSGVSLSTSTFGNALISTAYGRVELASVAAEDVTKKVFVFDWGNPNAAPRGRGAITGTASADTLVGTDLADHFIFTTDTAFAAVDTIKDFRVKHGNTLDIADLLIGYDPLTHSVSDFAKFVRDPETHDVILAVDRDSTADAFSANDVALIVDGSSLGIQNLFEDGLLLT